MKKLICVLTLALALAPSLQAKTDNDKAESIIKQYLKTPHPEDDTQGELREVRLEILGRLKIMPEAAVSTIARILPELTNQQQRCELAETLGRRFQTAESAKVLCALLKDKDKQVRGQAIHGLRLMSRRTDRIGARRIIRQRSLASKVDREKAIRAGHTGQIPPLQKPVFTPKVGGLVPYLILAAGDESEKNRISALYALADTREPAAVTEIRNRLSDKSERVRLFAACFLTEYQDASGLPELRKALERLQKTSETENFNYYREASMLLASLERLLGKSFGPIPINPHFLSDSRRVEPTKQRCRELIDAWSRWWSWQPAK